MKKQLTAVYIGFKRTDLTQCISDERIMECTERGERGYSSLLRNKFMLYKQVSYTMTSDELTVAVLQWDVNTMRVRDGNNCTCRLIYDNGDYTSKYNEFPVDGTNGIVIICLLYTSRCV